MRLAGAPAGQSHCARFAPRQTGRANNDVHLHWSGEAKTCGRPVHLCLNSTALCSRPSILPRDGVPLAVATRIIQQANPHARIEACVGDVAKESVAKALTRCDYLFLAADSMRARLVFNALVHQYLIPGVQLGSKIHSDHSASLAGVMSANRPVRPGRGCLWCNQLIDATLPAKESKTDDERRAQAYGTEQPNPSVISLNAVSAAHAVNDFMLDYLALRPEPQTLHYEHFHFLKRVRTLVQPRTDSTCPECSPGGLRYGRGDSIPLPCVQG
jgi:hypothetical protein